MGVANASLIFDFSADGPLGRISGVIHGLDDVAGLQAATSIMVSVPGSPFFPEAVDVIQGDWWSSSTNQFIVEAGRIVSVILDSDLNGVDRIGYFSLKMHKDFSEADANIHVFNLDTTDEMNEYELVNFVSRVSVPEPSSVILLMLGLAGLSFARYRKQS